MNKELAKCDWVKVSSFTITMVSTRRGGKRGPGAPFSRAWPRESSRGLPEMELQEPHNKPTSPLRRAATMFVPPIFDTMSFRSPTFGLLIDKKEHKSSRYSVCMLDMQKVLSSIFSMCAAVPRSHWSETLLIHFYLCEKDDADTWSEVMYEIVSTCFDLWRFSSLNASLCTYVTTLCNKTVRTLFVSLLHSTLIQETSVLASSSDLRGVLTIVFAIAEREC